MFIPAAVLLDIETVVYLLNLAVGASFVCGLGLLAVRACRRCPAPVRHGILVGTLVVVLWSPVAVWLGQRSGLTLLSVAVFDGAALDGNVSLALTEGERWRFPVDESATASTDSGRRPAAEAASMPFSASGDSPSAVSDTFAEGGLDDDFASPRLVAVRSWRVLGTILVVGWTVGILVEVIRLAWGYRILGRFRRSLTEVAEPRMSAAMQQAAEAVGLRHVPRVFASPFAPAPFCLGLVKPVVVVPDEILRELDDGQMLAVLIHEAAHIVRRDAWVSLAQRIAIVLFWWNVLIYRIREQISSLREDICDDFVCRTQGEGTRFAQTLVGLAARATTLRLMPATLGVLEPTGLLGRVTRLLNMERNMATRMSPVAKAMVLTWTGIVLLGFAFCGGLRVARSDPANEEVTEGPREQPAISAVEETTAAQERVATNEEPGVSEEAPEAVAAEMDEKKIALQEGTEGTVEEALRWLAIHQMEDGGWSFNHNQCPACRGKCRNDGTHFKARNAATAMALLPFLGMGCTHKEGPYQQTVRNGLAFLVNHMDLKQGHSGSLHEKDGNMYSQGLGAIVLCETYAMTHDRVLKEYAQQALNFICWAQDPKRGGWRYEPQQAGDTSVLGWQLTALKCGSMAKLTVPSETVRKVNTFLDYVQKNNGARYAYLDPNAPPGEATTAVGLLCRMYLGWKKDNPALQEGVRYLNTNGPSGKNLYYDYYATQILHHQKGEEWNRWNCVMRDQLVHGQAKLGHEKGSWFFTGDHGSNAGGRLYCTAMAAMILEVGYERMPIYRQASIDQEFAE